MFLYDLLVSLPSGRFRGEPSCFLFKKSCIFKLIKLKNSKVFSGNQDMSIHATSQAVVGIGNVICFEWHEGKYIMKDFFLLRFLKWCFISMTQHINIWLNIWIPLRPNIFRCEEKPICYYYVWHKGHKNNTLVHVFVLFIGLFISFSSI